MHAVVTRTDLANKLSAVARIVEVRSTNPILSHVVLTAADGTLTARGTDLDVEVIAATEATVATPGVACVPAKNIADIVKRMVGETVTLELEPGSAAGTATLIVKCGRSRFKLPSVPHESMPTLAGAETPCSFAADLAALFAQVSFAVGTSLGRANLMGVYLHAHDGKLRAVAADGARMAIADTALPDGAEDMPPIIVPNRVVGLVPKGLLEVSVGERLIAFRSAGGATTAKLIEGAYVEYQRAIPQGCDKIVRLNKDEFGGAVGRVGIIASEIAGKAVRLSIGADSVTITATDKDGRDAVDEVAAAYDGEPCRIAFNSEFLTEMLTAAPGDEIDLAFKDAGGLAKLTAPDHPEWFGCLGAYRGGMS